MLGAKGPPGKRKRKKQEISAAKRNEVQLVISQGDSTNTRQNPRPRQFLII